jgi:hypothetical protein
MKSQRPLAGGAGGAFFPLFQYVKDQFDSARDPEFVVDVEQIIDGLSGRLAR